MRRILIGSLLLAAGSSALTWWPSEATEVGPLDRKGQLLTPGSETIAAERVASLRVVTWDTDANAAQVFEVAQKGGNWVIPSHFDYPAEGGTRVGNTAGSVLNVPRGALVTDDAKRHAELGVVDPLADGSRDAEGRGKRITLKDPGGQVLVDLIVGKRASHANVNYVREASDPAVYTAEIQTDFSTAFKDWVETDPIKIKRWHVRHLRIEDYSVDEEAGTLEERAVTELRKPKDAEEWESATKPPEGKQVDKDAIGKLLTEITNLKLVGVRPYHRAWLNARGFYLTRDGVLKGNEGATVIRTQDGVSYHLFFGEIALGDEADKSADATADKDGDGDGDDGEDGTEEKEGHNRYMAVFVTYNETLDEDRVDAKEGDTEAPKSEGEKTFEKATERFGRFFYVIDDEAFQGLRPDRDSFFKDAEKEEETPTEDGAETGDPKDGAGDEDGDGEKGAGETGDGGEKEAGDAKKDAGDAEEAADPKKGDPAPPPPAKKDEPPAPSLDEPKQDDPAPDDPKKDVPKKDVPKKDVPKKDVPKKDVPKMDPE